MVKMDEGERKSKKSNSLEFNYILIWPQHFEILIKSFLECVQAVHDAPKHQN